MIRESRVPVYTETQMLFCPAMHAVGALAGQVSLSEPNQMALYPQSQWRVKEVLVSGDSANRWGWCNEFLVGAVWSLCLDIERH